VLAADRLQNDGRMGDECGEDKRHKINY
jgi:hypothetical protein